jgi:hypothetical protein
LQWLEEQLLAFWVRSTALIAIVQAAFPDSSLFSVEYGAQRSTKPQTPSSKSQAPNQGPSDVVAIQDGALKFGPWNFSGAWSLGFGASRRSDSTRKQ